MPEIGMSAVSLRAHARQLRWLLDRCRETDSSKTAIEEISQMISTAEHLAESRERHRDDESCRQCSAEPPAHRAALADRLPNKRWLRFEEAWQLLHIADESLLTIAPDHMLLGRIPEISAKARRWLDPDDARVAEIAPILHGRPDKGEPETVSPAQRYALAQILHSIHFTWDRNYAKARSFHNLILTTTVMLSIGVAILIGVGMAWPEALPLCTTTQALEPIKCASGKGAPDPGDVALVALLGAIAAGFAAVAGITRLRPLVDPYKSPVIQGLLKVPTGAFTAILGVLAIEQGLRASAGLPSSQGGILFLAFVFGYSQQLVTRFVDSYGAQIRAGLSGQRARDGVARDATTNPM